MVEKVSDQLYSVEHILEQILTLSEPLSDLQECTSGIAQKLSSVEMRCLGQCLIAFFHFLDSP